MVFLQGVAPAAPSGGNKLVRTTRIRRQTTPETNQTLQEQPIVFNHVYNINVPAESLCSVDLDSSAPSGPAAGKVFLLILSFCKPTACYCHPKTSSQFKGPRAELGSSPSVEGPINPAGPAEYTEQTLDAESQVSHCQHRG